MARSVRWFGAALIAAAFACAADAQTTSATPTLHARGHHHRRHAEQPEGRQITVHKSGQRQATQSWLTLGTDAPVGTGNNYVTSTFDQSSTVQGTFMGWRGRGRVIPQYGVPGTPLFTF